MENLLQNGREHFPLRTKSKEVDITLGISTYLIMVMTAMHFTFGILAVSNQYVGSQLKCYAKEPGVEEICLSNAHYLPVGHEAAQKYQSNQETLTFAYYKLTNWIFMIIGKSNICHTIVFFN